eukprot:3928501-Prymnesium_polylepis.1
MSASCDPNCTESTTKVGDLTAAPHQPRGRTGAPHAAAPPTAQCRSLPPPPPHTAATAVGRAASAARAWP